MKKLLILLAVVTTVMLGVLPVWATDYYVANSGSDSNSGSISDPWKTIAHVNSTTEINSGDVIHFARGNTWRIPEPENGRLIPRSGATYTAYDIGDKPLFLGSVTKNRSVNKGDASNDWVDEGGNIWSTTDSSFGAVAGQDVGNIIFNNEESTGDWKLTQGELVEQGDFYYEENSSKLYLYSAGNPADVYSDIECAVDIKLIEIAGKSYVTISDLDLRYTSAHAIWVRGGSNNITVRDNDISYIGGALQGTVARAPRYGNGIELWNDVNNIWVNRNRVREIYDAALTNQGDSGTAIQDNIYFQYNVVWNSAYSYEYLCSAADMQVRNIYVDNNTFVNAGDGWSFSEDKRGYSIRFWNLGSYANASTIKNFNIRNNIIYQNNNNSFAGIEDKNRCFILPIYTPGITLDHNSWYKYDRGMIEYRKEFDTTNTVYWYVDFSTYQNDTLQDLNSIAASPAIDDTNNPRFVDIASNNYRLQAGSPCIDAGQDIGLTQDFDCNPVIPPPDMGAFEFSTAYTITATAGTGGSISPSGDVIVNTGADQAFEITADTGYQIADVLVDGELLTFIAIYPFTETAYTFTNVTSIHTIEASFGAIPTYTITATAGTGGSISPSGNVIANDYTDQTFEITADTGYQIADVLVDGVSEGPVSIYTFTSVTDNHSIEATFSIIQILGNTNPGQSCKQRFWQYSCRQCICESDIHNLQQWHSGPCNFRSISDRHNARELPKVTH